MDKIDDSDEMDHVKNEALEDNTAQGIRKKLREIENQPEVYKNRWIWELFQNAIDAKKEGEKIDIVVEIKKSEDGIGNFIFKHNGRPFKPKEVVHLIYHGTTKKDDDIGEFGTGFITTHLISNEIDVKGVLKEKKNLKKFNFKLNREKKEESELDRLKEDLDKSWKEYKNNLKKVNQARLSKEGIKPTAKYEYEIKDEKKLEIADSGIEKLKKFAPFVMAFNNDINSLKIKDGAKNIKYSSNLKENDFFHHVTKKRDDISFEHLEIQEDDKKKSQDMLIGRSNGTKITIKGKYDEDDNIFEINKINDIPKLFLGFPLMNTKSLPLPMIINSKNFEPTESRDGIFLGEGDSEDISSNYDIIEKAITIFMNLISEITRKENSDVKNIHNIFNWKDLKSYDWISENKFKKKIKKNIFKKIKEKRILRTEKGLIEFEEGYIPILDKPKDNLRDYRDICSMLKEYNNKLPAKNITLSWHRIIRSWEEIFDNNNLKFLSENKITIEKLSDRISKCKNINGLKDAMCDENDENIWKEKVNRLYEIIKNENQNIFEEKETLLNQNGKFCKKENIWEDEVKDKELKRITKLMNDDIKEKLLHQNLKYPGGLDKKKTLENVSQNFISKMKDDSEFKKKKFIEANVKMFEWILKNKKYEYISRYPAILEEEKDLEKEDDEHYEYVTLEDEPKEYNEIVLAPKSLWDKKIDEECKDLFPENKILYNDYAENDIKESTWDNLRGKKYIKLNPLYNETIEIKEENLEPPLLVDAVNDENVSTDSHEHKINIECSRIAYLDSYKRSLINISKNSKKNAKLLLKFILEYVIDVDEKWKDIVEKNCCEKSCEKKYELRCAEWLKSVKEKKWIPVKGKKNDVISSKSLSNLYEDYNEIVPEGDVKIIKFLRLMNVSVTDLSVESMIENDEEKKIKLDGVGAQISRELSKIDKNYLDETRDNVIELLEEKEKLSKIAEINRRVGRKVEEKIENRVSEYIDGKINRTGTGSDYRIEIEGDENILIEIKSTKQNFVFMSKVQAKKSIETIEKTNDFALCAVKIEDGIDESSIEKAVEKAKFVPNIGEKIKKHIDTDIKNLESGNIQISTYAEKIKFKIKEPIWDNSYSLEEFLEDFVKVKNKK